MSQREMAERLGELAEVNIPYKNVSKYERDKGVPPMEVVLAYSDAVGVNMEQIIDDDMDLNL